MRNRTPLQVAWLVLVVTVALPAWAADPGRPAPSAPPGAPKLGTQPLKAPIKLDPASLRIEKIPPLQRRDEIDRAWDDFRQKYDATLAAINRYQHKETECLSRTYSIADQRNAGCSETDTLAVCNRKLYHSCTGYLEDAPGGRVWTRMQMGAVTLRQKLLDFSNDPRERR